MTVALAFASVLLCCWLMGSKPGRLFGVFRGIRGVAHQRTNSDIYGIARLFDAVARRDVDSLANLQQYLQQNMKKLSDSLCECDGL